MKLVILNETEQRLAKTIAILRYQANRKRGTPDMKIGDQSAAETDLEGAAAEIAYCKAMNLYPDLETAMDKGRPAYDAVLPNGETVDVKSTKRADGRLLVRARKQNKPVDWYALVTGEFPRYKIIGHMRSEELFMPDRFRNLGYGPSYVAEQHEFRNVFPPH